jgi:hypothetical protein
LRFIAAVALLGALASLLSMGIRIPLWLVALLLLGGVFLLLYRGNLARRLIAIFSAIVLLMMFWRGIGPGALGLIGVMALIMLAVMTLMSPFFKKRW